MLDTDIVGRSVSGGDLGITGAIVALSSCCRIEGASQRSTERHTSLFVNGSKTVVNRFLIAVCDRNPDGVTRVLFHLEWTVDFCDSRYAQFPFIQHRGHAKSKRDVVGINDCYRRTPEDLNQTSIVGSLVGMTGDGVLKTDDQIVECSLPNTVLPGQGEILDNPPAIECSVNIKRQPLNLVKGSQEAFRP